MSPTFAKQRNVDVSRLASSGIEFLPTLASTKGTDNEIQLA